ncbi:MAG: hypothetical protein K0U47_01250 [Epsilonproteobacteria bacterium]|nr:hypothetical protein [Campylobacterota bacterium]
MTHNFLHDQDFSALMVFHIRDIIDLLLQKGEFFSILTNISEITFDPILPHEIAQDFKPITLFVIAEYTFESCTMDEENLYFEAGFGHQNVGSFVTIPLSSIVQIVLENTPIFINLSHKMKQADKQSDIDKSTNIFLKNPENKAFAKD